MSNENEGLDDAIASLQAAFSDGASHEAMKKGEHVLGAMLAALRGAMSASETPKEAAPAPASTPEYTAPTKASSAPSKKAAPNMLDFVVGFLKSKLDDEDRAAIETQAPPFSVPFINM